LQNLDSTDYKNLSFWSWNGELENTEIILQIESFAKNNYGGFFMHARAGLGIPYLGDRWFEIVEIAIEQAQKNNLSVWIYDEYGWPSGFAGGLVPSNGVEYCFKKLLYTFNKLDCDNGVIISSYKKNDIGYILADANESELFFYYTVDTHYVDLLYPLVTQKFIESTHEKYKQHIGQHFGKAVKGIFTDEPQLSNGAYPWSFELSNYFEKKTGSNLIENLWMLAFETTQSSKFKHDFFKCVNSLMTESFTMPISNWCKENNLIFTGHFSAEDSLLEQVFCSGGVMPNYQYMQMPGIDHLGRRTISPIVIKQAVSVAKQMGFPRVISESFGCCGWNIPFSELSWLWGIQAALGINIACIHVSSYSIKGIRKRDYPAFFSYQEPWWDKFNYLSSWMNNLNFILSLGEQKTDILLINPLTSIWSDFSVEHTDNTKHLCSQYRCVVENLIDVQVDFDIGDETILKNHAFVDGKIFNVGKCKYNKVLISATNSLEENTVNLLKQFIDNGGDVIFVNKKPNSIDGIEQNEDLFMKSNCIVLQNRRDFWRKYFDKIQYDREVFVLEHDGFRLAGNLVIKTKKHEDNIYTYLINKIKDAKRHVVLVTKGLKSIYEVNPSTMERNLLKSYSDNTNTYVELSIEHYQSILLEMVEKVAEYKNLKLKSIVFPEFNINICNENSINLDYACYSFDGINFSEKIPVIFIHDKMYDYIEKQSDEVTVTIRYEFISTIKKLNVAIEDENVSEIRINNISVVEKRTRWYIDKSIGVYEISDYTNDELNVVDVVYKFLSFKSDFNVNEVFETERNRFCYPIEPESIYILGDFDVETESQINHHANCITVVNNNFSLVPTKEKIYRKDLTQQGLWFYRGDVIYSAVIDNIPQNTKACISISNIYGVLAEVYVDDYSVGCIFNYPYELDITQFLVIQSHKIDVKIYGSNRNILGPHHHINGENLFVGLSTFKGIWGFEDSVVNQNLSKSDTWTKDYSFVKFGCEDISVKYFVDGLN